MFQAIDPATAFAYPLKLKYRTRYTGSSYASTGGNSGKAQKSMQGTGHRRRSYGPFDTFTLSEKSKTKKE